MTILQLALLLLFSSLYEVRSWDVVSLEICFNNQSVDLFMMSYDNCMLRYDAYGVKVNKYPGVAVPLSVEDLQCLIGYDAFRSCALCHLCHYYLYHQQDIFAYKYALRSLEASPRSSPAFRDRSGQATSRPELPIAVARPPAGWGNSNVQSQDWAFKRKTSVNLQTHGCRAPCTTGSVAEEAYKPQNAGP